MNRVTGIDHISIRVSNYSASRVFYARLFDFLGFEVSEDYGTTIGWTNGKTRFWIAQADAAHKTHKHAIGDIGLHHYAFQLRNRRDVEQLHTELLAMKATIVDPPGEYYDDYYAVFFLDPDGFKLEGMRYGEKAAQARRRAKVGKD